MTHACVHVHVAVNSVAVAHLDFLYIMNDFFSQSESPEEEAGN